MKQNKFIWLNPVIDKMIEPLELKNTLKTLSFQRVFCQIDHISATKKAYIQEIDVHTHSCTNKNNFLCQCVADVRCPLAAQLINQHFAHTGIHIPNIPPILIQSAFELVNIYAYRPNSSLWIITPCEALAELGEKQHYPNTTFITWKKFKEIHQLKLTQKPLHASPIPPGFFNNLGKQVVSLYNKTSIEHWFQKGGTKGTQLVEMLYCHNGCHNGDGIKCTQSLLLSRE